MITAVDVCNIRSGYDLRPVDGDMDAAGGSLDLPATHRPAAGRHPSSGGAVTNAELDEMVSVAAAGCCDGAAGDNSRRFCEFHAGYIEGLEAMWARFDPDSYRAGI